MIRANFPRLFFSWFFTKIKFSTSQYKKNQKIYLLNTWCPKAYILKKFRIWLNLFWIRAKFRINNFRITVYFFLTGVSIIKCRYYKKYIKCRYYRMFESIISEILPSKFPDKSSAGLTRFDCNSFKTLVNSSPGERVDFFLIY